METVSPHTQYLYNQPKGNDFELTFMKVEDTKERCGCLHERSIISERARFIRTKINVDPLN